VKLFAECTTCNALNELKAKPVPIIYAIRAIDFVTTVASVKFGESANFCSRFDTHYTRASGKSAH